jgi:hypothetical protein
MKLVASQFRVAAVFEGGGRHTNCTPVIAELDRRAAEEAALKFICARASLSGSEMNEDLRVAPGTAVRQSRPSREMVIGACWPPIRRLSQA